MKHLQSVNWLLNESIIPENTIEQNEQTVNRIYLNTWALGIDTFPPNDSTTLLGIATQNPLAGGGAVYSARVMLGLVIDDNSEGETLSNKTDDEQSDNFTKDISKTFVGKLYPNPTNNNVELDYQISEGANATLIIFDAVGRKLFDYSLDAKSNHFQINTENLSNGVYLYQIKAKDIVVQDQAGVKSVIAIDAVTPDQSVLDMGPDLITQVTAYLDEVAEVVMKVRGLAALDEFEQNQKTGRFMLMDGYNVVGGGIIREAVFDPIHPRQVVHAPVGQAKLTLR